MSFTKCRGVAAKEAIVAEYNLKPVIYIRLLNGQNIDGCCGPITDKYYLFEAEHKETQKLESFCVGYDCANQFLQLIDYAPLQLFNPFQASPGRGSGTGTGGKGGHQQPIAPLNKELKDAIHIICSAWGGRAPKGSFRSFLEYINTNPARPTKAFAITNFNQAVGKDAKGRTLTQIIQDLRLNNPNLRNFTFPLMEQVLQDENCTSNL